MPRPITPTDLWTLARVGQPEPLPAGSSAVVPVTTHDLDANAATTRLHLVTRDGGATCLTPNGRSAAHPAVDPSGKRVAFLREPAEDTATQIHVMPLDGGEAECVTDFPLGAGPAVWLPDGSGLVVAVPLLRGFPSLKATAAEQERREDDPLLAVVTEDRVYRHWNRWLAGGRIHHLFLVNIETETTKDLTPDWDRLLSTQPDPVGTFDVSPDGRTVAVSADVVTEPHDRFQFAVHLVPIEGGDILLVTAKLPAQQQRPRFSPDGGSLLYGVRREQDFSADPVRLALLDLATREESILTGGWDRSAAGWEFVDNDRIIFHAEDAGRLALFSSTTAGAEPEPIGGEGSWHGPRPAGEVVWCRHESSSHPPEVAVIEHAAARVVTSFNDSLLAELDLGAVDELTIAGSDDRSIQVQLVYPPGYDQEQKWPLVHNVHGGPHGLVADTWHWRWNTQVFAAGGYVVASVNFHGSTSWGDEFTRSIRGAWGDKPANDVLAATDHLVGLGFIDEDRMAIAGGSYGGYLVTWLTTQTDRFACSICHAGVTDLLGQWASDVTAGREKSVGGVPWEDLDAIQRWSPLAHTTGITTPTLVIHGELDYRVVVTQGLSLYGILKHKGVPARLVYYPDEGHWIEKPLNSVHWYGEFASWLERWIGHGPS